jgi:hypothetical protein
VVDLASWAWNHLWNYRTLHLRLPEPVRLDQGPGEWNPLPPRMVTIRAEAFLYRGKETMMLFAPDEALGLTAAFLPGQRGELQRRERIANARGFMEALGSPFQPT